MQIKENKKHITRLYLTPAGGGNFVNAPGSHRICFSCPKCRKILPGTCISRHLNCSCGKVNAFSQTAYLKIILGHAMQKCVFGKMRTAKAQISLRIRAVWSGPLLCANWIIRYCIMYRWRAKDRMVLCACAGWSEPAHFAHVRRHVFAWHGTL